MRSVVIKLTVNWKSQHGADFSNSIETEASVKRNGKSFSWLFHNPVEQFDRVDLSDHSNKDTKRSDLT